MRASPMRASPMRASLRVPIDKLIYVAGLQYDE